ncbi:LOW QUALITY PROTEIN: UBN2 domain-containing protein, partial [Cephalotus follicularis]
NLWDLIVDGPNLPTITLENGDVVSKPRNIYDDNDRKSVQINAKAKHIIIYAINSNDFNRISCVSAKEMWDRLEVTYEGRNQVKEAKISMLVHDYEMFTMNENEDIKSMFSRFTNIINALQALDKTYSNNLLGSLMTHELSMQKKDDDEENEKKKKKKKKKKKIVALKSSQTEDSEDDDDDDDDEELAFITRRF